MTTEYERWANISDREATGERLSDAESEFLRRFASEDALAQAETEFWEELGNLDAPAHEPGSVEMADRAVAIIARKASGGRRTAWLMGGAVAAAAAVAFFAMGRSANHDGASALLELSLGQVRVGGVLVEKGGRIDVGSEVTVEGGPACLELEPRMHACLREGSVVKLTSLGAAQRRLDLVSGRVDSALAPLPSGEKFSVVANGTWSTAIGTAFSVEVLASGVVETIVHEGKVRVGGEKDGDLVIAHKIGLSQGGVTVQDLGDHARTETPDWKALGQVAGRTIEAPIVAAEAPAPTVSDAPADREPAATTGGAARIEAPKAPKAEPTATAADLLAQARQALREKRWADAATSYRAIVGTYPSSAEAHTVLVPLANLEVDRLGQAATGLKHLEAYLAAGGPLAIEAELAKIRAFRSLGRTADEAHAIDAFLTSHPKSLDADNLKRRRDELGQ